MFRKKISASMLASLIITSILCMMPLRAMAAVNYTVTTTADGSDSNQGDRICFSVAAGKCTLRAALEEANANTNPTELNRITFAIPGAGPHVLTPTGGLPVSTRPISIDGSTQGPIDCINHKLLIELNAINLPTGSRTLFLLPGSEGSSVKGISITGAKPSSTMIAGAAIKTAADNITITCNNIGVKADGVTADGNALGVVGVADNLRVGGIHPADGNLIGNSLQYGTHIQYDSIMHPQTPTGTVIQKNQYINNGIYGIAASNQDNVSILGNSISGTNGNGANVDYINGLIINNNTISSNAGAGIALRNTNTTTVQKNTLSANSTNGLAIDGGQMASITENRSINNQANGIEIRHLSNYTVALNVAGGNADNGISLSDGSDGKINGNFLGIDKDKISPLGNHRFGLFIDAQEAMSNTTIGGTTSTERNIITYNGQGGVGVFNQNQANFNKVAISGNYIGVDNSGVLKPGVSNTGIGVLVVGNASGIMIGGPSNRAGNIIAGNTQGGVVIFGISGAGMVPLHNSIMSNSIYGNGGSAAIDLINDLDGDYNPDESLGVTLNDPDDADVGPNNYINYPTITGIQINGSTAAISYTVQVNPAQDQATAYQIGLFAGNQSTTSGYGDGQYVLGRDTAMAVNGVASGTAYVSLANLQSGNAYWFTATTTAITNSSTGFGSTSEFGPTFYRLYN